MIPFCIPDTHAQEKWGVAVRNSRFEDEILVFGEAVGSYS